MNSSNQPQIESPQRAVENSETIKERIQRQLDRMFIAAAGKDGLRFTEEEWMALRESITEDVFDSLLTTSEGSPDEIDSGM